MAIPDPQTQGRVHRMHMARTAATDVVIGVPLSVVPVPDEEESALFAACRLTLRVERVERGAAHAAEALVKADVPCAFSRTREAQEERERRLKEAEARWRAENFWENLAQNFWLDLGPPWPPEWTMHRIEQIQKAPFIRLYLNADGTVPYGQYYLLPKLPD